MGATSSLLTREALPLQSLAEATCMPLKEPPAMEPSWLICIFTGACL